MYCDANASTSTLCRMYCDANGEYLNPAHARVRFQYKVERAMRLFYRLRYTHHRYMATHDSAIVALNRAISHADSRAGVQPGPNGGTNGSMAGATVFDEPRAAEVTPPIGGYDDRAKTDVAELHEASADAIEDPDHIYLNLKCAPYAAPAQRAAPIHRPLPGALRRPLVHSRSLESASAAQAGRRWSH
jgi:hypothetical protein